jgi:MFS family permease
MKPQITVILKLAAAFLWSFVAGIAASSFYIGDRNLLVTLVAILLIIGSVVAGWWLWKVKRRWSVVALCACFALGFLCSVFGIC